MLPSRAASRGLRQDAAASDLADPYLAGYARLQQTTALLTRRRRRDATGVLRYPDQAARRLAAAPLCAQIATPARRARIDLAPPFPSRRQPRTRPA
jgi:hypothetical protein